MAKLVDPNLYSTGGIGKSAYLDEATLMEQLMLQQAEKAAKAPPAPVAAPRSPATSRFPALSQAQPLTPPPAVEQVVQQAQAPVDMQEQDYAKALEDARSKEGTNNLMKAANALLGAQSQYQGVKTDMSAYDALLDNSTNLAKGKASDMSAKEKFSQDLTQGKLADAKTKKEADDLDPNSNTSKSFRQMLETVAPDVAAQYKANGLFDKIAAGDYDKLYNPLALRENIKSREQIAKDNAANRMAIAKENAANRKALQDDKLAAKEEKEKEKSNKPSYAEQQVDKKLADTVTKWAENQENIRADIEKLKKVEKELETLQVSGPIKGNIPTDALSNLLNPEGVRVQNDVASVTQKNLRETLGGQFAQKEGQQLLERAYNARASEASNLERVKQLRLAMEAAAQNKDALAKIFADQGTFKGVDVTKLKGNPVEVKRQYSPSRNQTKIIYSDGTEKIIEGGK